MKHFILLLMLFFIGCAPEPAAPRNMVVTGAADVYATAANNPNEWVYALGEGDHVTVYEVTSDNWAQIADGYWVQYEYLAEE